MSASSELFMFQICEWLFLISGGLTTAYVIKLFVALFIMKAAEHMHQKDVYITWHNSFVLTVSALILPVFGIFTRDVADVISILGSGFMNSSSHHHIIDHFTFTNLEGSLISISIGIVVYFAFIQRVLIKNTRYVDLWPEKLNIENALFRPVIGTILPFIGALFARLVDLFTAGPVALMLSHASRIKFIKPPEDTDFGYYHDESKTETISNLLPSSLAYGLVTFAFGLLFVIAFMMT